MFPFETGANRNFFCKRLSAAVTSGHASSRCHATVSSCRTVSERSVRPRRGMKRSRLRRCSTSSLQNGMRPDRTSSIPGWYSPLQASAKRVQSRLCPRGLSARSASLATPVRQSTRVPNTSKNIARMEVMAGAKILFPARESAGFAIENHG